MEIEKRYYYDNIEALGERERAKNKYKGLSEEEKIKRENMEEKDIITCMKKISNN